MLVVIESPYAGDIDKNLRYLRDAIKDCVKRGESPYASHLMIASSGALNDLDPEERKRGIELGFLWLVVADKSVAYIDLGVSKGMAGGIRRAIELGKPVEIRSLEAWKNEDTFRFTAFAEDEIKIGRGEEPLQWR